MIEQGTRFERLVVIERAASTKSRRRWLCQCDCGAFVTPETTALLSGKTKSCGCYKLEMMRVSNLRHGMTGSKTHETWRGMLKRCRTPASSTYKNYGGRGITVCDRWLVFENFLADMGKCPEGDYSIERQDVNGNYEPGNCIWLPRAQQGLNTRRNHKVTIDGVTKPLTLWCQHFGLPYNLVHQRITLLKWAPERALMEPSHA